ncbi:MAG: hypothetical protein QXD15_06245, partial [Thermoplasmata archaeon]
MKRVSRIIVCLVLCGMLLPISQLSAGNDHIFVSAGYEPKDILVWNADGVKVQMWLKDGKIRYQIGEGVFSYYPAKNPISLVPVGGQERLCFVWEDG